MGKKMLMDVETFRDFFGNGMGRELPKIETHDWEGGDDDIVLNLGAGDSPIPGADNLDLPDWYAPDLSDYADGSVDAVHAYHFLEHLPAGIMLDQLREIQRVLAVGGFANIVVPYAHADIAFQDPTHQTFFTEETWRTILDNRYYDMDKKGEPWKLHVGFNLIAGIVGRNLSIFTQLIRGS